MSARIEARYGWLLLLAGGMAAAQGNGVELVGHTKLAVEGLAFPADSLFRESAGETTAGVTGELRLDLSRSAGRWSVEAGWQLILQQGENVAWRRDWLQGPAPAGGLPGDERRYMDLTHVMRDRGETAALHRLDRLSLGYATEQAVVRVGRQALSWGNGLFYTPMDLVNPFDPAAVDTEFKPGDDMLYAQVLRGSGDDVQAAYVVRRDPSTGDATSDTATLAVKYHAFGSTTEFDLLVASHYSDAVLGLGAVHSLGGAVWRGDAVVTLADDTFVQLVTSLSYSWTWGGRNVSGAVEYFFNGFGQAGSDYDPGSLAANGDLIARIGRGELYTLGRHYLAGSLLIELTPLWTVTPVLLANLGDPGALLQVVTRYSLGDNLDLLASLNVPAGADGTEFGGIPAGPAGRYLATSAGVFAQLAWYF